MKYLDSRFVNFRDYKFDSDTGHKFQWIDIKNFAITDHLPTDRLILRALVESVEYKDDYVGGGVDPAGTRHGPYWLSAIGPQSFDPINADDAIAVVNAWLANCRGIPEELHATVATEVIEPIRAGEAVFELRDLGPVTKNDYGDLHIEFHELVVISRERARVALIVLTDD